MSLFEFLKEHTIVTIGNLSMEKCIATETISDDPQKLVEYVIQAGCYISEIRWWHRVEISTQSEIGYGGTLDPRDPNNYYFAETDIVDSFDEKTTIFEYTNYLSRIKTQYKKYDLYPAFDIIEMTKQ